MKPMTYLFYVKLNSHIHYYLQPGWQRIGEKYRKDGFHAFSSDCNYQSSVLRH